MAKPLTRSVAVLLFSLSVSASVFAAHAASRVPTDDLCAPIKAFVASVKPRETRMLGFETSWFNRSTSATGLGLIGRSCHHEGYEPAKVACAALLEHASTEFAGINAMRVIMCLSPGTRFAPQTELGYIAFDLSYGSSNRGQNVSVVLEKPKAAEDPRMMTIEVDGY
jgi:hypothetical protein